MKPEIVEADIVIGPPIIPIKIKGKIRGMSVLLSLNPPAIALINTHTYSSRIADADRETFLNTFVVGYSMSENVRELTKWPSKFGAYTPCVEYRCKATQQGLEFDVHAKAVLIGGDTLYIIAVYALTDNAAASAVATLETSFTQNK